MTWNPAAGHEITSARIGALPRGIIARGRRTSNSSSSSGTTAVGVLRLDDIAIESGRAYRIYTSTLKLRSSVASDRVNAFITYTTDGSTPTTSSSELPGANAEVEIGTSASNNTSVPLVTTYFPGANQTLSLLLCTKRVSGTGNSFIEGSSTGVIDVVLEDVGTDPTDDGVDI